VPTLAPPTMENQRSGRFLLPSSESRVSAIQRTVRGLQSAAVRDIRSALAEGDISAILLTNNGEEFPISVSRWRERTVWLLSKQGEWMSDSLSV
jgi:hypothetical protein